ncbi:MAG: bifunctional nuclease family protein [Spirochaetales bacterium]|nr:bifunctional nuclease family protein [Spirochaetales bacterium]
MKNGMLVEAEIWTVAHTEQGNAVLVRPLGAEFAVPIFIGQLEAHSILIGLGSVPMPRPLTHDLFLSLVDKLDAFLEKVEITELKEGTFYSRIVLRQGGKRIVIDARPSDALSLAARIKCPIYIAEPIVTEAGVPVKYITDESPKEDSGPNPRELEINRLKAELEKALEAENYEEAVRLRDRLRELEQN